MDAGLTEVKANCCVCGRPISLGGTGLLDLLSAVGVYSTCECGSKLRVNLVVKVVESDND